MTSGKQTFTSLSNGLKVMLTEIHTAPLLSTWLWYRVGSRNETPGKIGLSHWLEHMMFKGTQSFPNGVLDKEIARQGGYWNAMTYLDWTTYFSTMPLGHEQLILEMEADRMQHCRFDENEVELERTVIISEREGEENSPLFMLDEAVQNASFSSHPYQYEVIGSMQDLHAIRTGDLQDHYQRYYQPNNAVLCIAGDFETKKMMKRIDSLFAPIPSAELPVQALAVEPQQQQEKRLEVFGPGDTSFMRVSYHPPATNSDDFFALSVLDSLLTGASNLNLFGGGIPNKTSLLYKSLVDGEWAVSVGGGLQATIDPFLYSLVFTVHPDKTPEELLRALDIELEKIQQCRPTEAELARAVKQARALFAYGSESISNQAFWLGFSEMFDSYTWFESYIDRLAAVTPDQVNRVAQHYLRPSNRTIGYYLPNNHAGASAE